MIIQDLMINDLVLYKGHVKKVVGIKRAYNLIDLAINDKDFFTCSVTDIEPIPLTEEILKKNGFEEYRDGVCKLIIYRFITYTDTIIIEPMKIESRIGNNWFWFSNKDREMEVVKPRIVYPFTCVHELQHALRLCGLTDLADNLKIE